LPFISEEIYQNLKERKGKESVHLLDFPEPNLKLINKTLEKKMEEVRLIVAQAFAERAKAEIKVRQPLGELRIKNYELRSKEELLELIKEEVNVKEIVFDSKIKKEVELDTKITPELEEEGILREIVHSIQVMRKKRGLKPEDKISVYYQGGEKLNKILFERRNFILREIKAENLVQNKEAELDAEKEIRTIPRPARQNLDSPKNSSYNLEIKIGGEVLWLGLIKL